MPVSTAFAGILLDDNIAVSTAPDPLGGADFSAVMRMLRRAAVEEDRRLVCVSYLAMRGGHPGLKREDLLHLTAHGLGEASVLRWRLATLALRHQPPADATVPYRWVLASQMDPSLPSPRDFLSGKRRGRHIPKPSVEGMLADAFSHHGCYMCKDGSADCDYCEGFEPPSNSCACPDCEGTGLLPCRFCGGTGWVDAVIIPPEVRPEALRCCRAKVLQEAADLVKAFGVLARRGLGEVAPRHRRRLVRWTLRTRCRLRSLESEDANSTRDVDGPPLPSSVVLRVERCWRSLVSRGPRAR